MKNRFTLVCMFVLACAATGFSQKETVATQRQPVKQQKEARTPKPAPQLTVSAIDQEISLLENVLIINKDDKAFKKEEVLERLRFLRSEKIKLTK